MTKVVFVNVKTESVIDVSKVVNCTLQIITYRVLYFSLLFILLSENKFTAINRRPIKLKRSTINNNDLLIIYFLRDGMMTYSRSPKEVNTFVLKWSFPRVWCPLFSFIFCLFLKHMNHIIMCIIY